MSYLGRSILVVKQLDDKYSNIAFNLSYIKTNIITIDRISL